MISRRPETVAWLVIWTSFAIFVVLVAGAAVGIQWYLNAATDARDGQLTIINGTVLVREVGQTAWVGAGPDTVLENGDSVKTDATSEALITLFDKSTVILFPQTELELTGLKSARFDARRESVVLSLHGGKLRISVAQSQNGSKQFEVRAPQGAALLSAGRFSITVEEERFKVWVKEGGEARVSANAAFVELGQGEKTEVLNGAAPLPPQAAREEIIRNGTFLVGLEGWEMGNDLGFPEGQDVVGEATAVIEEGETAVRFLREGSRGTHCETFVFQQIDKDVSEFSSLRLSLNMKLINQSLSGGGYLGSEYPVMVRLHFRDAGGDGYRVWGFYYQNEANNRTDNGIVLDQNAWVEYEFEENLVETIPRIRSIISIQLSASGWDYHSLVGEISLVGE